MYAIRLELKTNWRFILIINVFSFSSKGQTSFKTEITVPQIHIYTLIAIIQKVTQYYISKDTEKENQSIITGDAKGIK